MRGRTFADEIDIFTFNPHDYYYFSCWETWRKTSKRAQSQILEKTNCNKVNFKFNTGITVKPVFYTKKLTIESENKKN